MPLSCANCFIVLACILDILRLLTVTMTSEQIRVCLLYEFKLGHSAAAAARNITGAWGEDSVSERVAQLWFARFRSGDTALQDEPRPGRPSVIDDDILEELIKVDPRQTVRELAVILKVDPTTVCNHLHKLGKVRKLEKWVPHTLSEHNKAQRLNICASLLSRHKNDPFLDRIITCDEKWILYDNPHRAGQWVDADQPPAKVPKRDIHSNKVMVTVWWSRAGIIHYDFLKTGDTITAEVYCQQLDKLDEKLSRIQPALRSRKVPLILHDNARPHTAKKTLEKLKNLSYEILPHPPYSPDVSPTDYHFFRSLSNFLQGKCFRTQQEVEKEFTNFLNARNPSFYISGINQLVERWQKVIDVHGDYFDE